MRLYQVSNIGAFMAPGGVISPTAHLGGLAGTYTTPAIYAEVSAVFTNTTSIGPFRGSGRPEASYYSERLIDNAAREMGIDRAELRRRNTVPASAMPFKTGLVFTLDSGEFEKNLDMALHMAGYDGFRAAPRRSQDARQAARHRLRQHHRADLADLRRDGDGEIRSRRHGDRDPGLDLARPGPRHDVQDHPVGKARHRFRSHPRADVRYRHGARWRRHLCLAHRGARRQRRDHGGREGHRQGEEDRRAYDGSVRRRRRIRRRQVQRRRHRQERELERSRGGRLSAVAPAARASSRVSSRPRPSTPRSRISPMAAMSARSRSIPRPA